MNNQPIRIHTKKVFFERRRELRKPLTDHEKILWSCLKGKKLGFKFQRQHSIGNYIVDFYCARKRLIIELDGNQHLDNQEYDRERTLFFQSLGYHVLRFWNSEITTKLSNILMQIEECLTSSPNPN